MSGNKPNERRRLSAGAVPINEGAQFNVADVHEQLSAALADRTAIVHRGRRVTWAELNDRSRRLANYLHGRGLGARVERRDLQGHESGQDHVALYLYNCPEYLEGMLGTWKARTVPF